MVVEDSEWALQTDLGEAVTAASWSYVKRIDAEMESAGFPERRFPMIYLFALSAQPRPMTISEMGRRFAISRQAASKIVAELRDRGYVQATTSTTDQRQKVVDLTPKAIEYLSARRRAASALDREIRKRIGDAGLDELHGLLAVVGEVARGDVGFDPPNVYGLPKRW
jgi:DNA-binding MarR family transcriptional regulator